MRLATFLLLAVSPSPTFAQTVTGAIGGTVRDSSGAVIPGVTVEASSPALIEKVRAAATDGEGIFKIENLAPGEYTVTFSLTGFTTLKREGIQLSSGVTATVNAEMRVGSLAETITVSGLSPLVDVQNTNTHRTISSQLIEDLPTGKNWSQMVVLIPGVSLTSVVGTPSVQDVGGSTGDRAPTVSIHGSRSLETPMVYDGMRYAAIWGSGGGNSGIWVANAAAIQEFSIDTAGAGADAEVSGLRTNVIPKQGGNRFSCTFIGNFTNDSLQANNLDAKLRSRGISTPFVTKKVFDIDPAFGGPLRENKIWFYGGFRYWGTTDQPPNAFYNTNPNGFSYIPDKSRPAVNPTYSKSSSLRLTFQTSPTSKLSVYGDNNPRCWCANGISATTAYEATTRFHGPRNNIFQATWNWTISNRLLLELGQTYRPEGWTYDKQDSVPLSQVGIIDAGTGISYRGVSSLGQDSNNWNGKGNLSYVTGSHNLKFGGQWFWGQRNQRRYVTGDASYVFVNGAPTTINLFASPVNGHDNLKMNLGTYVQEQYVLRKLTLNAGVRFDYVNAYIPAQNEPPARYVGARTFPEYDNLPNWKDITPRLGASYDPRGDGKTAIKWSLGKYVEGVGVSISEVVNPMLQSSTYTTPRGWQNLNRNFIPDCDLTNPAANGECGAYLNGNFGKAIRTTRYDPSIVDGWRKRGYNWEVSTSVQRELVPGLSVEGGYYRRWYGNLRLTYNAAVSPTDFNQYCIATPADPRLPGGGSQQICGLYDIDPASGKLGVNDNVITLAKNFGDVKNHYDAVDFNVSARLPRGIVAQAGTSTGRFAFNDCGVVIGNPQVTNVGFLGTNQATLGRTTGFCDMRPPFLTQGKALAVVPLPWWGIQTSATYQTYRAPQPDPLSALAGIQANWAVPTALIAPSLGRNLAGGARTATVAIAPPGSVFADRLHQVDLRISKNIRASGRRIQPQLDLYNLFNANTVLAENASYAPPPSTAWLGPTGILPGRIVKFGVLVDF
jgi:hypothetical protein